jgi:hypothetical protein
LIIYTLTFSLYFHVVGLGLWGHYFGVASHAAKVQVSRFYFAFSCFWYYISLTMRTTYFVYHLSYDFYLVKLHLCFKKKFPLMFAPANKNSWVRHWARRTARTAAGGAKLRGEQRGGRTMTPSRAKRKEGAPSSSAVARHGSTTLACWRSST